MILHDKTKKKCTFNAMISCNVKASAFVSREKQAPCNV